jgi:acyl-CoA synthetase (AMP-forming)/AMP-acid ligase II
VPLIRPKIKVNHGANIIDFNKSIAKQPTTLKFDDLKETASRPFPLAAPRACRSRAASQPGIIYNAWLGDLLFEETDVQICPLPLFHVFATIVCMGASLSWGRIYRVPTPQGYRGEGVFDNFWKLIERTSHL